MRRVRNVSVTSFSAVVAAIISLLPAQAGAATYEVTATSCIGSGSFTDAVAQANLNPGLDTIIFRTDVLNVQDGTCGKAFVTPDEKYMVLATDDLVIEGNGHTIVGNSQYVTLDGLSNVPGICPAKIPLATVLSEPVGLMRLGASVNVTVNDLNLRSLRAIADLDTGSDLTINRMRAKRIFDFAGQCDTSAIFIRSAGGQNVTINDSAFIESWNDANAAAGAPDGKQLWLGAFIKASVPAGTLSISGSTFDSFAFIPAIEWNGTANVVSSQILETGFMNIRGGAAVISNSILMSEVDSQGRLDRIMASGGSTVTLEASTVAVSDLGCDAICQNTTGSGLIVATDNASIELKASAISVGLDGAEPIIREATGGDVTATPAPNPNWIQPTAGQNASALRAILDQPALLTDAPGLPQVIGFPFIYQAVTPLLDDGGGSPGLLIDAVTNANTTNVLLSPIDGSPVTEDIFGNPRTEAAGTVRNIGAIQLSLAPSAAVSTPSTSGAVVSWTRPLDPDPAFPITGYGVIYEPIDGSAPPVRIDVAGADNLSVTLTGLAPDTEYKVTVVAVNANGDGPPSNVATFDTQPTPPAAQAQPVPAIPPALLLLLLLALLILAQRTLGSGRLA